MTPVQLKAIESTDVVDWIHERLVRGSADPFLSFVEFSNTARQLAMDERLAAWADVAWLPCDWQRGPGEPGLSPGEPLPGPDHLVGSPIESCYEMVKRSVESARIRVEERPTFVYADGLPIGRCKGWAWGRTIAVDPLLEPTLRLNVLIHELAHLLLDHERPHEFEDEENQREVAAETIAWLVLRRLGFATGVSSEYVVHWSRCISRDTLREMLDYLEAAFDRCFRIISIPPWLGPRDPLREADWTTFPLPGAIEPCDD
jgi:hypothetical protein